MIRERNDCRLCGSNVESKLSLAATPLANELELPGSVPTTERFPLDMRQCVSCGHVQLGHVVDPVRLFADYGYATGTSQSFRKHFSDYARDVMPLLGPAPLVVEIGSNDGTLLSAFGQRGARVFGFEPSAKLYRLACDIRAVNGFFTPESAAHVRLREGAADCITANNVLAHIDDLDEVMRGVKILLKPDGVFVFEVQYFVSMIVRGMFDMVYHEHLDYHHVMPLQRFLAKHGFDLFDVKRVETHGGSIRCFARRKTRTAMDLSPELKRILALESMHHPIPERLIKTVSHARQRIGEILRNAHGTVAAYGAPAKLTTLVYSLNEPSLDRVQFVVDDNPLKQGKLTPGKRWPIVPTSELVAHQPDHCVIFAWNVADDCIERARAAGYRGKFIVPLPVARVVS